MSSVSNIPECHGIYGVHESEIGDGKTSLSPPRLQTTKVGNQLAFATGGIQIGRPLLPFSKERLIATCKHHQAAYVEDGTNVDPTLTRRNAIRYIFKACELPSALQKPALLQLADRNAERRAHEAKMVQLILDNCVIRLEPRCGSLTVNLPDTQILRGLQKKLAPHATGADPPVLDAEFVRRVVSMITPQETVSLDPLQAAVWGMDPHGLQYNHDRTREQLMSFTCAGLQFCQIGHGQWQIWRQRPSKEVQRKRVRMLDQKHQDVLFDNRFWIHLRSPKPVEAQLIVRFATEQDLARLRTRVADKEIPETMWAAIESDLRRLAPGNQRFSLPVIAKASSPSSKEEHLETPKSDLSEVGDVIALPTLGYTFNEMFVQEWEWLKGVNFHVMFRKVDLRNVIVDERGEETVKKEEGNRPK
ncbi:hypothetical protein NA57DRAFT_60514 [Rhizodiscina lignyota]|uniref:tRNA(Ile)-lysidine/2-thiocytidine synthase N-terminal domain-containing protein n=1 Tax=Rhizodiscina lignyota TaxID=1504668 RepID=A0A9P4I6Q1_9PEZI|nr:hypothetical protein NA57DRAFT_60514 [Rhizodiscina lignyota]